MTSDDRNDFSLAGICRVQNAVCTRTVARHPQMGLSTSRTYSVESTIANIATRHPCVPGRTYKTDDNRLLSFYPLVDSFYLSLTLALTPGPC